MPRRKSTTLTNAELRIMEVVWARGAATVAEVVEALEGKDAYTTILTLMRILKIKGYLASRKEGRAFVFIPRVDRDTAARKATHQLLHHPQIPVQRLHRMQIQRRRPRRTQRRRNLPRDQPALPHPGYHHTPRATKHQIHRPLKRCAHRTRNPVRQRIQRQRFNPHHILTRVLHHNDFPLCPSVASGVKGLVFGSRKRKRNGNKPAPK